MVKGYIYCYYINNKYYVGKTYRSEKKRQKQHKYDSTHGTQTPFCSAIRKYDWENVLKTYQVLETLEYETLEELNYNLIERENYWIDKKNALLPNGYNVHYSNHKKVPYIPNKKERYEKISKALKGKNNNPLLSNRIVCVETNVIYPSIREAERQNGYIKGTLCHCLNGKQKTSHGYHWKYVDKETPEYSIEKARKKPLKSYDSKCISIICLETNKVYKCINDCVRDMKWHKHCKRGVSNSCKRLKSYRGYNFRYFNQDNPVPSLNEN